MGHVYEELSKKKILQRSKYFSDRLILELCENIHLHYRNIRLEFDGNEFADFYRCFKEGFKKYQKYVLEHSEIQLIKLEDIDPFDSGHVQKDNYFDCGTLQQEHINGINFVKSLIAQSKKIRPIAITTVAPGKYKRMDGFKRYWAFKELGYTEIECYILPEYIAGIQEDMPEYIE